MDSVIRAASTYLVVWLVFRLSGKRTLSQITTFDLVLLLIISETTQNALNDGDHSMTNSLILLVTFFAIDIALSYVKKWFPQVERVIEGEPLVLAAGGKPISKHLDIERVSEDDILAAARQLQGVGRMHDIDYAILECDGQISVIPRRSAAAGGRPVETVGN